MEEWLLIRDLYSQGFSISKIARQTGYARETVRKYLNKKTVPEPQKRPGRKSKLDPYKPYILEKLNEGPYTASRLYREIKETHIPTPPFNFPLNYGSITIISV